MTTKQPAPGFDAWWSADEQAELRRLCARGWANYVWQASRAALAVKLPPAYDEEPDADEADKQAIEAANCMRYECVSAIAAAGVTVK